MTKKSVIFWNEPPVFLPKQALFLTRNLQAAAVVRVRDDKKMSEQ
jgi:hypothetical protein